MPLGLRVWAAGTPGRTPTRSRSVLRRLLLALLLVMLLANDCQSAAECEPTMIQAEDGAKVDLADVEGSSTVSARLTARGAPLPARTLRFELTDDGATVHSDEATTGDDGVARLDLKQVDPAALAGLARADGFTASFAGDGTYCPSRDVADLEVVNAG